MVSNVDRGDQIRFDALRYAPSLGAKFQAFLATKGIGCDVRECGLENEYRPVWRVDDDRPTIFNEWKTYCGTKPPYLHANQ